MGYKLRFHNSFDLKDDLKFIGARWDGVVKAWWFDYSTTTDERILIDKIVEILRVIVTRNKNLEEVIRGEVHRRQKKNAFYITYQDIDSGIVKNLDSIDVNGLLDLNKYQLKGATLGEDFKILGSHGTIYDFKMGTFVIGVEKNPTKVVFDSVGFELTNNAIVFKASDVEPLPGEVEKPSPEQQKQLSDRDKEAQKIGVDIQKRYTEYVKGA